MYIEFIFSCGQPAGRQFAVQRIVNAEDDIENIRNNAAGKAHNPMFREPWLMSVWFV